MTPSSTGRTYDQNPRQGSSSWRNRDFGHRRESAACQADGECDRVNNEKKQEPHCCSLRPPDLASLLLTRGLFFDESSEGELCFRGAFIFAILVALLRACKSSDRALARRVLSGFEYLRKAFKKLSVPHTRSIQAQILNPESLTPSKSPMWTFPISRRLTGHQRRFGIRMQSVFTRIPQMMRLKKISLLRERITKPREYPFNIPTIASLNALEISSRVCFCRRKRNWKIDLTGSNRCPLWIWTRRRKS